MNFTRDASLGRRVAAVLAVGALLLGGCDRQNAGGSADPGRPGAPAVSGTAATSDGTGSNASGSDVNGLLNEVDKQLNADDQPVEDQD